MAFKRSGVRLPLAPPAFARFASFGLASQPGCLGRSERRLPRVIPAQAGTQKRKAWSVSRAPVHCFQQLQVLGPRFRGDDS